MKKPGTIVRWDSERESGYIRSPQTPADVYFHLRDYDGPHPVALGTEVVFDEVVIGGKGPRALSVSLPPPPPLREAPPLPSLPDGPVLQAAEGVSAATLWRQRRDERRRNQVATGLLGAWSLLWLIGIVAGRMPWVIIIGVVLVNIATLFLYWRDQHVSQEGGWPWPDEHLHVAALLGGWPAAWLAQHALSHRLDDAAFQRVFLACSSLNALALLTWVSWPLWRA